MIASVSNKITLHMNETKKKKKKLIQPSLEILKNIEIYIKGVKSHVSSIEEALL